MVTPQVIACTPVDLAAIHWPNYLEQSERLNQSTYRKVHCPKCGDLMWLGERSAGLVRIGVPMLCAVCVLAAMAPKLSRLELQAHCATSMREHRANLDKL